MNTLCLLVSILGSTLAYNFRHAIALPNSDGITVSWSTKLPYAIPPQLQYGVDKNNMSLWVQGDSIASIESVHHHATTLPLEPSTNYYFSVLDGSGQFKSPPAPDEFPLKIALYGDMGVTNSENTMKALKSLDLDLFVHIGDISYADDRGSELDSNPDYESIYDEFLGMVEDFSNNRPYMVCPGNHDVSCHSVSDFECNNLLQNFGAFNSRFRMPSEESKGAMNVWYSFNFGPIHFVSINSESDYPGSPVSPSSFFFVPKGGSFGKQLEWLENDLAKVDTTKTPWIVVYGHRPMFDQALFDWPLLTKSNFKNSFEKLLLKYKVDFYIAGHIHGYERNARLANGKASDDGVYHITVGSAGSVEKLDKHHLLRNGYNIVSNYISYGFGVLTIHNSSWLEWNFHNVDTGKVEDVAFYSKLTGSGAAPRAQRQTDSQVKVELINLSALSKKT